MAVKPGVVTPAVRQGRVPRTQERLLFLVLLHEVPVPLHRGVVLLAFHRSSSSSSSASASMKRSRDATPVGDVGAKKLPCKLTRAPSVASLFDYVMMMMN